MAMFFCKIKNVETVNVLLVKNIDKDFLDVKILWNKRLLFFD